MINNLNKNPFLCQVPLIFFSLQRNFYVIFCSSEVQGVIDGVHRIKDHAMPVPPLPPQVVQPVRTRGKGLFSRFSSSSSRSPSSSSSNNLVNHNADDIEHKVFDVKPNVTGNNAEAGSDLIGVTESPPLSATVVRQLMHKSVAAIIAFYGFEQVCLLRLYPYLPTLND